LPFFLKQHLILTSPLVGLTDELAIETIVNLNKKKLDTISK